MRNGNFNEIYQKYHRFSVNSARKIVKDEMLAEDISQEVFYHLYEIRDTLEPVSYTHLDVYKRQTR